MPSEFDLIHRYFQWPVNHTDLGGGDDAALITPTPGHQLAVSADMLVEGRHFFKNAEPEALGWKSLAVNLSDIAAMGGVPRWAFLSLALPAVESDWLDGFARGFRACANTFDVDLAGGDTTRGPLTINVTIMGEVPTGRAITRAGAQVGDEVWVSGQPGRAALALWHLRDGTALDPTMRDDCMAALHRPQPRTGLGIGLRGLASAMLDVSDGLLGDLGHILASSGVGVRLREAGLPTAHLLTACGDAGLAHKACLTGGDDYELLFTAPAAHHDAVEAAAHTAGVPVHAIGTLVSSDDGCRIQRISGRMETLEMRGFDHFTPDH